MIGINDLKFFINFLKVAKSRQTYIGYLLTTEYLLIEFNSEEISKNLSIVVIYIKDLLRFRSFY